MRESKYNVSKNKETRMHNEIIFDSMLEKRFYVEEVIPRENNGDIVSVELQKKYVLQPEFKYKDKKYLPISYIADFVLHYKNGSKEVIDVKGNVDALFAVKKKMLLFHYPDINFRCIGYSKCDGGFVDTDYIAKQRKKRKKEKAAKTAGGKNGK